MAKTRKRAATPFGVTWQYAGAKTGGVNRPGTYGGVYQSTIGGNRALFKQDTRKDKVRVAKVMGEGVAGPLLNSIFNELKVDARRVAQVDLVRAGEDESILDESGQSTYLKSVFINGYKEDFWKYAYRQYYEAKYRAQFANFSKDDKKIAIASELYLERLLPYYKAKLEDPKTKAAYEKKYDDLTLTYLQDLMRSGDRAALQDLARDLADIEVNEMKRPSAVIKRAPRKVANKTLNTAQFRREFAEITAPRLLIADFGVHNGNFGVAQIDGKDQLVCLDYGAAFCRLPRNVSPFSRAKTGTKVYKNHFLEYGKTIIASKEMADVFIRIGNVSDDTYKQSIDDSVKMLESKYGIEPLKKFCQRLGMKPKEYKKLATKEEVVEKMREFMTQRMLSRKESLKMQGFALLLEHCIDKKGRIDHKQLAAYLSKQDGLYEFAIHQFLKMPLVLHAKLLPEDSRQLKAQLVAAVKNNAPIQFRLESYVKLAAHYEERAALLYNSGNPIPALKKLEEECDYLREQLMDLRDNESVHKTSEQLAQIAQALKSIATTQEKYMVEIDPEERRILHFSSDSIVVTAPNPAALDGIISEKVKEFSKSPAASSLKHDQIATTNEFHKNTTARINHTVVENHPHARLGLFKPKKTLNFVSVQHMRDNSYVSDIYFDPNDIKHMSKKACMRLAVIEIENFLSANVASNSKIIISYGMPAKLVEAMMTYCEWQKTQFKKPEERTRYECVNLSSHTFSPSKKDVRQFEKRLEKYQDGYLGMMREYGLLDKDRGTLHEKTRRRDSDPVLKP